MTAPSPVLCVCGHSVTDHQDDRGTPCTLCGCLAFHLQGQHGNPAQRPDGMTDAEPQKVLVIFTVPKKWSTLEVGEIHRKLAFNADHLLLGLAQDIKRWGAAGAVDLTALRERVSGCKEGAA